MTHTTTYMGSFLPPGYEIQSTGRALRLMAGDMPLLALPARRATRRRVTVCLIFAARFHAERAQLKRQEMALLRSENPNTRLKATEVQTQWIEAQKEYDRAMSLALGRLGARPGRAGRTKHTSSRRNT